VYKPLSFAHDFTDAIVYAEPISQDGVYDEQADGYQVSNFIAL
jgi:hypothetical protein